MFSDTDYLDDEGNLPVETATADGRRLLQDLRAELRRARRLKADSMSSWRAWLPHLCGSTWEHSTLLCRTTTK
jgi:hypothetical protein